jgi:hypothetical protein
LRRTRLIPISESLRSVSMQAASLSIGFVRISSPRFLRRSRTYLSSFGVGLIPKKPVAAAPRPQINIMKTGSDQFCMRRSCQYSLRPTALNLFNLPPTLGTTSMRLHGNSGSVCKICLGTVEYQLAGALHKHGFHQNHWEIQGVPNVKPISLAS